jgi:hypothetical protein
LKSRVLFVEFVRNPSQQPYLLLATGGIALRGGQISVRRAI